MKIHQQSYRVCRLRSAETGHVSNWKEECSSSTGLKLFPPLFSVWQKEVSNSENGERGKREGGCRLPTSTFSPPLLEMGLFSFRTGEKKEEEEGEEKAPRLLSRTPGEKKRGVCFVVYSSSERVNLPGCFSLGGEGRGGEGRERRETDLVVGKRESSSSPPLLFLLLLFFFFSAEARLEKMPLLGGKTEKKSDKGLLSFFRETRKVSPFFPFCSKGGGRDLLKLL